MVTLTCPPLRDRPEDILTLANHFAKRFAENCGRPITGIAPAARAYLQSYSWPGNVRELENAIERRWCWVRVIRFSPRTSPRPSAKAHGRRESQPPSMTK